MTPHLVRWHNEFQDDGLVIIEIDNGSIDSLTDVEEHVRKEGIPFALLHDADGEVTDRFGVNVFPTAFLFDRSGKVVWHGNPTPQTAEQAIRNALAKEEA